jgi:recombinational DNA repair ATPase RecF
VDQIEAVIWAVISKNRLSKQMVDLIKYALRSAECQGVELPQTIRMFLVDDVRYHLDCDRRDNIVSTGEGNRLEQELDRLISTIL